MSNRDFKFEQLRSKARELLMKEPGPKTDKVIESVEAMVNELEIYEVELELQNNELQEAQEALEISKRQYMELFENAPSPYFILSSEGVILKMNRAASVFFGGVKNRMLGLRLASLITENVYEFNRAINETLSGHSSYATEVAFYIQENIYWARVDMSPREVSENDDTEILCSLVDITERKRAAEMLLHYNNELEEMVRARTRKLDLLNAELQKALNENEVLNREVHHRVGNNLSIISGLLSLQSLSIKQAELKMTFEQSIARINSIARAYRLMYKNPDLSRLDISAYLRHIAKDAALSFPATNNRVNVVFQLEPVFVEMDRVILIGLSTHELITNSYAYAYQGRQSGELVLRLKKDAQQVTIEVQDSGSGFSPDLLTGKEPSTTGLLIVRSLVSQLRGTISMSKDGPFLIRITFPL